MLVCLSISIQIINSTGYKYTINIQKFKSSGSPFYEIGMCNALLMMHSLPHMI